MADLLERALNLITPVVWGREHGYDVPDGNQDDWDIARIRVMRDAGRDDLAEYLIADRLRLLRYYDDTDGTSRVAAFTEALDLPARSRP